MPKPTGTPMTWTKTLVHRVLQIDNRQISIAQILHNLS